MASQQEVNDEGRQSIVQTSVEVEASGDTAALATTTPAAAPGGNDSSLAAAEPATPPEVQERKAKGEGDGEEEEPKAEKKEEREEAQKEEEKEKVMQAEAEAEELVEETEKASEKTLEKEDTEQNDQKNGTEEDKAELLDEAHVAKDSQQEAIAEVLASPASTSPDPQHPEGESSQNENTHQAVGSPILQHDLGTRETEAASAGPADPADDGLAKGATADHGKPAQDSSAAAESAAVLEAPAVAEREAQAPVAVEVATKKEEQQQQGEEEGDKADAACDDASSSTAQMGSTEVDEDDSIEAEWTLLETVAAAVTSKTPPQSPRNIPVALCKPIPRFDPFLLIGVPLPVAKGHLINDRTKRYRVRYCTPHAKILGELAITDNYLSFEPETATAHVQDFGAEGYRAHIEMSDVLECGAVSLPMEDNGTIVQTLFFLQLHLRTLDGVTFRPAPAVPPDEVESDDEWRVVFRMRSREEVREAVQVTLAGTQKSKNAEAQQSQQRRPSVSSTNSGKENIQGDATTHNNSNLNASSTSADPNIADLKVKDKSSSEAQIEPKDEADNNGTAHIIHNETTDGAAHPNVSRSNSCDSSGTNSTSTSNTTHRPNNHHNSKPCSSAAKRWTTPMPTISTGGPPYSSTTQLAKDPNKKPHLRRTNVPFRSLDCVAELDQAMSRHRAASQKFKSSSSATGDLLSPRSTARLGASLSKTARLASDTAASAASATANFINTWQHFLATPPAPPSHMQASPPSGAAGGTASSPAASSSASASAASSSAASSTSAAAAASASAGMGGASRVFGVFGRSFAPTIRTTVSSAGSAGSATATMAPRGVVGGGGWGRVQVPQQQQQQQQQQHRQSQKVQQQQQQRSGAASAPPAASTPARSKAVVAAAGAASSKANEGQGSLLPAGSLISIVDANDFVAGDTPKQAESASKPHVAVPQVLMRPALRPDGTRVKETLLTATLAECILDGLPVGLRLPGSVEWVLRYSPKVHGVSLATMFRNLAEQENTILIVKDADLKVFGGFAPAAWAPRGKFYGSGEAVVFEFLKSDHGDLDIRFYPWTSRDRFIMYADHDVFGFGGKDGKHALSIRSDLLNGFSCPTDTYGNPTLANSLEFVVKDLEVWSLEEIENI
eukprot:CAMPEP_0206536070 /NCGR_PEP_ID=MMETSP0325_2-20121206/6527_1 /ASSEMBLY_ACC=CAM_ASM_000347 /TAXON_ID=2866 /ORGANISM="Crypthecodinium cohnii, Strain Seligo" /LENGTH=1127 /DNA_ID=CAMNT_0054033205 /DNA_START=24 /DNA_END=3407 /DNA_ORIENTATION=-